MSVLVSETWEAVNVISGAHMNETHTLKRHNVTSDEYLFNISPISNLLIS